MKWPMYSSGGARLRGPVPALLLCTSGIWDKLLRAFVFGAFGWGLDGVKHAKHLE